MFDIGFSELLLIGVVALIVIGPERLPGVARTVGHLFGRMQRYVNDVKADIQREVELDELKKLRESVEQSAREIEQSVSREFDTAEREMRELQALADPDDNRRIAVPDEAKIDPAVHDDPPVPAGASPESPTVAGSADVTEAEMPSAQPSKSV